MNSAPDPAVEVRERRGSVQQANLLGPDGLIVILIIVVVMFGGSKIPQLAKGLGQGLKEFKTAVRDEDEEKKETAVTPKEPSDKPKPPAEGS